MASIDYNEAKKELNKLFHEDEYNRTIIFWYDEPKNFFDDISKDTFENAKILVCEKNAFEIKHILEIEDTESNYLIYCPCAKPKDIDNWLLDILLYSNEYYADTVALTMRRLNLSNSDLRRVIERHFKFFDSELRITKLNSLVTIGDSMTEEELKKGMMAVLVKSKYTAIDYILRELVFDIDSHDKYEELNKFGFEEYLWDEIATYTNYSGQVDIKSLVKKFIMTSIFRSTHFKNLSAFYMQYVIDETKEKGAEDAEIFVNSLKSDTRYTSLQLQISSELRIDELLKARGIDDFNSCDVLESFDKNTIQSIIQSLNSGSLDYDFFERIISENRINSMWYESYKNDYMFLMSSIRFLRVVETIIHDGLTSEEYIKSYVDKYYEIDYFYRHVITNYKNIVESSDIAEELMTKIDGIYEAKYLSQLGNAFTKSLKSKNSAWIFPGVLSTNQFYMDAQKTPYKKMFVIISDAMRFEVGYELLEMIKTDPVLKGNSKLTPMVSSLPSETRFGMASLLPNNTITYKDKTVFVNGLSSSGTENREKILKTKNSNFAAIQFETIYSMNRNELRQYMQDKSLVYIYHNVIDKTGENSENKVFDVVSESINEVLSIIKKLYNSLQISNFYITADHGFMYRRRAIESSQKLSDIVGLKPLEASKRYVITNEDMTIPYTLSFGLDYLGDNTQKVLVPYSYDFFKTPGGGIQFIHGGASLQEIIVPMIKISELRSDRQKDIAGKVGIRIKSVHRKIKERSFNLDFEQFEKVEDKKYERTVLVYFEDEDGEQVSGEYRFLANSNSDDLNTRVNKIRFSLKNIEFDRNVRYFLVVKDSESNEILEREQFVIDILGFKPII
ncbi:MAG: BREX-1 system phosphatase PglZ type A [Candidatus Izemoplasmataceae bacterium]